MTHVELLELRRAAIAKSDASLKRGNPVAVPAHLDVSKPKVVGKHTQQTQYHVTTTSELSHGAGYFPPKKITRCKSYSWGGIPAAWTPEDRVVAETQHSCLPDTCFAFTCGSSPKRLASIDARLINGQSNPSTHPHLARTALVCATDQARERLLKDKTGDIAHRLAWLNANLLAEMPTAKAVRDSRDGVEQIRFENNAPATSELRVVNILDNPETSHRRLEESRVRMAGKNAQIDPLRSISNTLSAYMGANKKAQKLADTLYLKSFNCTLTSWPWPLCPALIVKMQKQERIASLREMQGSTQDLNLTAVSMADRMGSRYNVVGGVWQTTAQPITELQWQLWREYCQRKPQKSEEHKRVLRLKIEEVLSARSGNLKPYRPEVGSTNAKGLLKVKHDAYGTVLFVRTMPLEMNRALVIKQGVFIGVDVSTLQLDGKAFVPPVTKVFEPPIEPYRAEGSAVRERAEQLHNFLCVVYQEGMDHVKAMREFRKNNGTQVLSENTYRFFEEAKRGNISIAMDKTEQGNRWYLKVRTRTGIIKLSLGVVEPAHRTDLEPPDALMHCTERAREEQRRMEGNFTEKQRKLIAAFSRKNGITVTAASKEVRAKATIAWAGWVAKAQACRLAGGTWPSDDRADDMLSAKGKLPTSFDRKLFTTPESYDHANDPTENESGDDSADSFNSYIAASSEALATASLLITEESAAADMTPEEVAMRKLELAAQRVGNTA